MPLSVPRIAIRLRRIQKRSLNIVARQKLKLNVYIPKVHVYMQCVFDNDVEISHDTISFTLSRRRPNIEKYLDIKDGWLLYLMETCVTPFVISEEMRR